MLPLPSHTRLGALPLPIILGMIAVLDLALPGPAQLGPALRFDPVYLSSILYTLSIGFTSFVVTYISLKSYLRTGRVILLLLGGASLVFGCTGMIGSWLGYLSSGPNAGITIANTGALFASVFHVASGTLGSTGTVSSNNPRVRRSLSISTYLGVVLFTVLLSILSLDGLLPLFFVPGAGPTFVRSVVVGGSAILFGASSLLFAKLYFSSKSSTLYWYFLALALTSAGLGALFFGRAPGDPISWTGRTAQFLGGFYFLKAVLTAFKGPVESGSSGPS